MSGLADREFIRQPGEIGILIGQGQTAQVLRNLCYQVYQKSGAGAEWQELTQHIERLFGVRLLPPTYIAQQSEIRMAYEDKAGRRLDLSASGRGLQQTLLLLAYFYANPESILLLDEPDAHLEILRQRQTYQLISDVATKQNSQIIAASHSEVVLDEAASRGIVIAFVGKPHRMKAQGSQMRKALTTIGWDQYYQAEETGWVLYLEEATDLAILRAFARHLGHDAQECLEKPFVHYVANLPNQAREHFFGLIEAKPDLVGLALFDRLDTPLQTHRQLAEMMWKRREIENYVYTHDVLLQYAGQLSAGDLFAQAGAEQAMMRESIEEITRALADLGEPSPYSPDIKATDHFLDRLFRKFFEKLSLPQLLDKSDYAALVPLLRKEDIASEVIEKLDALVAVAARATPRND
jgi:hypothetical protein